VIDLTLTIIISSHHIYCF